MNLNCISRYYAELLLYKNIITGYQKFLSGIRGIKFKLDYMTSQFCHNIIMGKLKTRASKFVLLQEIFVLYLEKGMEKM